MPVPQHTIMNIKKKITRNYAKYNNVCRCGIIFILLGTQKRVENSHGKRASVSEPLQFFCKFLETFEICFVLRER